MRVYCDHAATTPMRSGAIAAMTEELAHAANPSSLHREGRRSRAVVEQGRDTLAAAVGAEPVEVIFVSGGTEANNLALKGLFWERRAHDERRRTVLVADIEHPCTRESIRWLASHEGAQVRSLPVTTEGRLELDALRAALERDGDSVALITVMWANHEVGTVQPVTEVARAAAEHGVPVHTDAVQAFGAVPVDFADSGVQTMSLSGHKIGGPGGIGALIVRRDVPLVPLLHGGGQERQLRSGTVNGAAVAGFAAAAREATGALPREVPRLEGLRDRLIAGVCAAVPHARLNGPRSGRLPGNAHFLFPDCEGDSLLFLLDSVGVASSTGSACTAGVPQPSAVLLAMGMDDRQARSVQRFSLGHTSTAADVDYLVKVLPEVYARARAAGMSEWTGREGGH